MFTRHPHNPLIRPQQITPSRPDFEVIGTFNAGAVRDANGKGKGDETLLLVRVAERPIKRDADIILLPHLDANGALVVKEIQRDDPAYDTADARFIIHRATGDLFLTSMSHLRLARSLDGVNFTIESAAWLRATTPDEAFGIEDARITEIDGMFYVNYTAVSPRGIATGLAKTRDFVTVERCGVIFPPANRDVTIFPAKIGSKYVCYHRPMPGMFGGYNIWTAESPDLLHWGAHRPVLSVSADGWESGRVGGGAPPIWTPRGWLSIYHAADKLDRYCLGAFLTPLDQPAKVIARARQPILSPEAPYEVAGFFGNVVFTCGAILDGETLILYYGASDETIARADAPLSAVLDALEVVNP